MQQQTAPQHEPIERMASEPSSGHLLTWSAKYIMHRRPRKCKLHLLLRPLQQKLPVLLPVAGGKDAQQPVPELAAQVYVVRIAHAQIGLDDRGWGIKLREVELGGQWGWQPTCGLLLLEPITQHLVNSGPEQVGARGNLQPLPQVQQLPRGGSQHGLLDDGGALEARLVQPLADPPQLLQRLHELLGGCHRPDLYLGVIQDLNLSLQVADIRTCSVGVKEGGGVQEPHDVCAPDHLVRGYVLHGPVSLLVDDLQVLQVKHRAHAVQSALGRPLTTSSRGWPQERSDDAAPARLQEILVHPKLCRIAHFDLDRVARPLKRLQGVDRHHGRVVCRGQRGPLRNLHPGGRGNAAHAPGALSSAHSSKATLHEGAAGHDAGGVLVALRTQPPRWVAQEHQDGQ
mmetsp:Transcript_75620/g.221717  ORF Transcript_75620/g.221717 Transcript_75620/m.221717 type:complete len:399 (+) Transcript_75620:408-1604(+)